MNEELQQYATTIEQPAVFTAGDERVDFDAAKRTFRDENGRVVTMDLAVSDVHTDSTAGNVLLGYRPGAMLADIVAPVVVKDKPSDKYFIADANDTFQLVQGANSAPGATVKEISPRVSTAPYGVVSYALASFVPTELEQAADSPYRPGMMAAKRVWNALALGREYRVATKLLTAASYATEYKVTLAAGEKWNTAGGDPIKNILDRVDAAATSPTHMVMSFGVFKSLILNPSFRDFTKYKASEPVLPANMSGDIQSYSFPGLPTILVSHVKYKAADGTRQYVWGNDPVLVRVPTGNFKSDGEDIATMVTFRWRINAEDARVQNGIAVRSFFQEDRGPNGGRKYVVAHYDDEKLVAADVGGLIIGAI